MEVQIRYRDDEASRLFQQVLARGADYGPLLAAWGERLKASIRQNFLAGGRPNPWAPLKARTARDWLFSRSSYWTQGGSLSQAGQRAQADRRPLVDQGMRGGLLGSLNWRILDQHSVAVGSDKDYAAIHQFGGTVQIPDLHAQVKMALMWPGALHPVKTVRAHAVTIPARPYLLVQEEDWLQMRQAALEYLLGEGSYK